MLVFYFKIHTYPGLKFLPPQSCRRVGPHCQRHHFHNQLITIKMQIVYVIFYFCYSGSGLHSLSLVLTRRQRRRLGLPGLHQQLRLQIHRKRIKRKLGHSGLFISTSLCLLLILLIFMLGIWFYFIFLMLVSSEKHCFTHKEWSFFLRHNVCWCLWHPRRASLSFFFLEKSKGQSPKILLKSIWYNTIQLFYIWDWECLIYLH